MPLKTKAISANAFSPAGLGVCPNIGHAIIRSDIDKKG